MWQTEQLQEIIAKHDGWTVEAQGESLVVTNEDGLTAFVAVSGEQILVETLLFEKDMVKDPNAFNEDILRTHKMFPLTSVGINNINNISYYIAFGSLSSQSKAESIMIEIGTQFANIEEILELYQDHLKGGK
uniref:DUF2170 family protein n=1 Tax=Thaumasiovibrio occultus TaxID=1891184 RepID=UPI000B34C5CD|nr:DUF2170 family protein [Thaumasiovibrio occultus]